MQEAHAATTIQAAAEEAAATARLETARQAAKVATCYNDFFEHISLRKGWRSELVVPPKESDSHTAASTLVSVVILPCAKRKTQYLRQSYY